MQRWLLVVGVCLLMVGGLAAPQPRVQAQDTAPPTSVTIAGTVQSKLGCAADWQPACDKTFLRYDPAADVWSATFDLPAGDYEYKAALNGSWDENYGAKAQRGGGNIPLSLGADSTVTFLYSHVSHAVVDSASTQLAVAVGDFQSEIGCTSDEQPDCWASWLQDGDGDGIASFVTTKLPAGTYNVRVALNQTMDEIYGADGAKGGAAIPFTVTGEKAEVYFGFDTKNNTLRISTDGAPKGDLSTAKAHWVTNDTILWQVLGTPRYRYTLHYAPEGGLQVDAKGVTGGTTLPLTFVQGGPDAAVFEQFPHLLGYSTFKLPADAQVPAILKGQLAIAAADDQGKPIDATALQIPGALDAVYRYDGELGVSYADNAAAAAPTLRLWAPTARSVALHLFADATTATSTTLEMTNDAATGVWSAEGDGGWNNQFYLYEVEVYVPSTGKVERNLVTDPYSFSLSTNSARSQIVNLNDPTLAPAGWNEVSKPALAAPEDIVLYELHIRDFSSRDTAIAAEERGTYNAFADPKSTGMQHLRELAAAGLTHIHLLPAFDIASIDEDKANWKTLDESAYPNLAPDAPEPQAELTKLRDQDGFNWGYDPWHYTAPEGSYSSDPNGPARIREFRAMVQALNAAGLRVVMDVVYNHTNAAGQSAKSVLDRIVPGYYHRLDGKGGVTTSTCCQNTATEHRMMEKLMVDSLRTWATAYKVDGFRFDLMGHHMVSNMQAVRNMLDELTPDVDGVDGPNVYVYGEGWNFGEVADNARGVNATQLNVGGLGIGTFTDRLRDAVRGGGPFSGLQEQGFSNGLVTQPNTADQRSADAQAAQLLLYTDQIKVGLAGNLRDFAFVDRKGATITGGELKYGATPAGYALDPQETINYVEAHDNETLWDAIALKAAPAAPLAERIRMHNLAMDTVGLAQGIPFFEAGQDLLRSKSLDRNSYNSGDWFNGIDWTGATTNWGRGLPPAENETNWPIMGPLLSNPALKPSAADVAVARTHFQELLGIRKSSPLFRLQTADEIMEAVSFLNNGPEQVPGLVVMSLASANEQIVVVFNATNKPLTFSEAAFKGIALGLHPIQAASADAVVKTAQYDATQGSFNVPALTTAVFVGTQRAPLPSVAIQSATTAPTTAATTAATAAPTAAATTAPTVAATAAPTSAPTLAPTLAPTTAPPTAAATTAPTTAATAVPTPAPASGGTGGVIAAVGAGLLALAGGLFFALRRRR